MDRGDEQHPPKQSEQKGAGPWEEILDRRDKEQGAREEGEGNYLSSSAVQLECRESEGVTGELMRGRRRQRGERGGLVSSADL